MCLAGRYFSQAFNMCVWQLATEQNQQIPFSKYEKSPFKV